MTVDDETEDPAEPVDADRVASRAEHLLPEEATAGSQDPEAQAEAILADSDRRSEGQSGPSTAPEEHRTSDAATEPVPE
jgi:hypothetical protein